MTDPLGGVTTYAYDTQGRLESATYPDDTPLSRLDDPVRTYHYEDTSYPLALTGITDENGDRFAPFAYDTAGRGRSSVAGAGAAGLCPCVKRSETA